MPVADYFAGKGLRVMRAMKRKYGAKAGKRVFYGTANKRKQNPKSEARFKPGYDKG